MDFITSSCEDPGMSNVQEKPGEVLRNWRLRRRITQMDLAYDAAISSKHLSFIETGRALASSGVLLRLADCLEMPLRARNQLLTSAGYAAVYSAQADNSAELAAARRLMDAVLTGHLPYPALVIDRRWDIVAQNTAVAALLQGLPPTVLTPPVNILRLSLRPDGLAPHIENLAVWRHHLLSRFRRHMEKSGAPDLREIYDQCLGYGPHDLPPVAHEPAIAVPLHLRLPTSPAPLRFISTTLLFGSPHDVTLDELAIECFYPADPETRQYLEAAGSTLHTPETLLAE